MDTTRRNPSGDTDEAAQHVLVIGGNRFGLAVAEYLTAGATSATFVSEDQPTAVTDDVTTIHRELSDAYDVRPLAPDVMEVDLVVLVGADPRASPSGYLARRDLDPRHVVADLSNPATGPAFEDTDVDRIDVPQLLDARIRDRDT